MSWRGTAFGGNVFASECVGKGWLVGVRHLRRLSGVRRLGRASCGTALLECVVGDGF